MIETKLGTVTNVRSLSKGFMIDILSFDGVFYNNIEVLNTPGLNEIPVASDIPERNPEMIEQWRKIFGDEQADSALSISNLLESKIRTLVLFVVIRSTSNNDHRTVIPIKFLKNYALESKGSPPIFMKTPKIGEIAIQAAGNVEKGFPGGYLYLNNVGDVKLRSGLDRCMLNMTDLTGLTELFCSKLKISCNNFLIDVDDGVLSIKRSKYLGPGVVSPIQDVNMEIDKLGNITFEVSPSGTSVGKINIDPTGNITITGVNVKINNNTSNITIDPVGNINITGTTVKLNNGMENIIKGLSFMQLFNSHVHIGNLGAPTAPPTIPMTTAHLSPKTFTE